MPQEYFLISLFAGIMIPTLLITLLSGFTIKLLEFFKFFKKESVFTDVRSYITGSGLHRTSKVYLGIDKNGSQQIVNGKVFLFLVIIFLPISFITSYIVFYLKQ